MECVGAGRTVASLGMEEGILGRFEALLGGREGGRGAGRWGCLVVAVGEGVPLLCMAFVLW